VRGAAPAAIGVALGGALGNVVDVWRHGGVVDFIDLGWWPVFNLADAAIVGGVLVAIWYV
jgi:signal peptidase II